MPHRIAFALVTLALVTPVARAQKAPAEIDKAPLRDLLEEVRKKHDVPALGAAIVTSRGVIQLAVVGVRKRGGKEKAGEGDLFHLGSCTKALTATLIAILIEKKLLAYDRTFALAFPELAEKMPEPLRKATLGQCLGHRAGLPANLDWWDLASRKGDVIAQRERAVRRLMGAERPAKPGEKMVYSNAGYVAAAAMAERATKKSYEDLLADHVTGPLKMASVGFGAMGTKGKTDQPLQHDEKGEPVDLSPFADNPPVMGPAGRVHCSLADWSKFVADQLAGAQGKGKLTSAAAYRTMHAPLNEGEEYTLGGWGYVASHGGVNLSHDGSNTHNYASSWLHLRADVAVLVVCNQGPPRGKDASHEARDAIITKWLR